MYVFQEITIKYSSAQMPKLQHFYFLENICCSKLNVRGMSLQSTAGLKHMSHSVLAAEPDLKNLCLNTSVVINLQRLL